MKPGERRGWLGGGPTHNAQRFGKLSGHFEKAPSLSHTQADTIPGEQRCSFAPDLYSNGAHTCPLHGPGGLHSRVVHGLQEGVSLALSYPRDDSLTYEFAGCLTREHATLWPQQLHGPWPCGLHSQPLRESLKWTVARSKLSYLDGDYDYLAAACKF